MDADFAFTLAFKSESDAPEIRRPSSPLLNEGSTTRVHNDAATPHTANTAFSSSVRGAELARERDTFLEAIRSPTHAAMVAPSAANDLDTDGLELDPPSRGRGASTLGGSAIAASLTTEIPVVSPARPCPSDFALLRVLGRGAYGKVLQVQHIRTGAIYAMKVLEKRMLATSSSRALDATRVERDVMTRLQHPYVVALRAAFQTRDKVRNY